MRQHKEIAKLVSPLWEKAFSKKKVDTSMKLDKEDSEYFDKSGIQKPWPFPKAEHYEPKTEWPFPREMPVDGSKLPPITGYFNKATIFDMATANSAPVQEELFKESDPSGRSLRDPGAKADNGKTRAWLCLAGFSRALEEVAKVTTTGADKYTPNGWVDVPNAEERYMDAAARHLLAYAKGEVYDNDTGGTGCKHLAQVAWNILAVLELQERQ